MKIGFVATRLAGVDGVSLETRKMVHVLESMGHQCFYMAGELDPNGPPGRLVPELNFNELLVKAMHDQAFYYSAKATAPLFDLIYDDAELIRQKIEAFVNDYQIDMLISQNASTIPMNLALGLGIQEYVIRSRIPTICHHHDFYWERDRFLNAAIQDILDVALPPRIEPVRHIVISTIMQRRLQSWMGVNSWYLPNVMDYDNPPPPPDEYALSFRAEMGLSSDDLLILQPTRIVRRKVIEKAIEIVRKMNDPRAILIITGYEGDERGGYGAWLHEEADRAGIRYRFVGDRVAAARGSKDGQRLYALYDVYHSADLITYPSTYEGFGNAILETIYFRKPFVVHTYPAYAVDIKPTGIQGVEFFHEVTPGMFDDIRQLLNDAAYRQEIVEHNYRVAQKHFSLGRMNTVLNRVLATF